MPIEATVNEEKQRVLWQVIHKLQIVEGQLQHEHIVMAYTALLELKEFLAKEVGCTFHANTDLIR